MNGLLRPLHDVTIAINGGVHLDLIKRIVRGIHTYVGELETAIFE